MSPVKEVIELMATRALTDVLVAGNLTSGGRVKEFQPRWMDVFLDFDGKLLRCSSANQYSAVSMDLVDEVPFSFGLMEGDEHCFARIPELCLRLPGQPQRVASLRVLVGRDERPEEAVFLCAGLAISGSDYLFLDPFANLFGLKIGREKEERAWERDTPAPEEGWDELVWFAGQGDYALRSSGG